MILVAEDHADSRIYLVRLLAKQGYMVMAVEDGVEAIKTAKLKQPKLLILDEQMPGMTGMEVFERLREDKTLPQPKVIFFSATFDHDLAKKALEMGAMEWLVKGVHGPTHILSAVARAMDPHC